MRAQPPSPAEPDPHDPLAPRRDDPMLRRWWWAARLYDPAKWRRGGARSSLRILVMVLLVGFVALGVVLLAGRV